MELKHFHPWCFPKRALEDGIGLPLNSGDETSSVGSFPVERIDIGGFFHGSEVEQLVRKKIEQLANKVGDYNCPAEVAKSECGER